MVRPVMFEIHKGQPILEKKSVVTDKDLMILEAYNKELRKTKAQSGPYRVILENIFLCLAIITSRASISIMCIRRWSAATAPSGSSD